MHQVRVTWTSRCARETHSTTVSLSQLKTSSSHLNSRPGVSWGYSDLEKLINVTVIDTYKVRVFWDTTSFWTLHWAGYKYILSKNIWMNASQALGWGYVYGMTDYKAFTNRMLVRTSYYPWLQDIDNDGVKDYREDGSGPWIFRSYAPPAPGPITSATSVAFDANTNYIISQANIRNYLTWSFSLMGDVNNDKHVATEDAYLIEGALGTKVGDAGYLAAADFNGGKWDMVAQTGTKGDGFVDVTDLGLWGLNLDRIP